MHLSFLLLVLCAVSALSHEGAYKSGYYSGRSADIVLDDVTKPAEIQLPWQLTKDQSHVNTVQDVHVFNLISRSLGLPQVHLPSSHSMESELDDSVPFNFFSSPTGNMLFSFEGLSSDDLPATTKILGRTPTYTLHQVSRPYHPLSELATVTTGTVPKKHGVVNENELSAAVPNFNDVAKGFYEDSVVIVGSSSSKFSAVLSAHKNADSYFWNDKLSAFAPLNGAESTVVVNNDNIASYLEALSFPREVIYKSGVEGRIGDVSFDAADNSLFAEIAFVAAWSSHLKQLDARKFFSFHFTSLASIAAKYGRDSQQWVAAVEVIDATIHQSLLKECTLEVIYLPTYHTERCHTLKERVSTVVSKYVAVDLFPQLYLNSEGLNKQSELCEEIVQTLAVDYPEVKVFCPIHSGNEKRALFQDSVPDQLAPITASIPDVLQFHYVFWTMLVIIAALSWATYAIATIEPDETLYTASTFYKKGGKAL